MSILVTMVTGLPVVGDRGGVRARLSHALPNSLLLSLCPEGFADWTRLGEVRNELTELGGR